MRRLLASCVLLGVCASRAPSVAVEDPTGTAATAAFYRRFKVSLGYHYSVGDYGTSQTTEIHYVPLVMTADLDRWRIQGTIPFLSINGPAGIIEGPNGPIQTTSGKSSGLGDLLLRGAYLVPMSRLLPDEWVESSWLPFVDLVGLVKFPTASRSQGLGTGEFDFGIETELTWTVGAFTPFTTLGYRVLGSPPNTRLSDVFVGSIGGLYRFAEWFSAGLLLDYRQSPSPQTGQQLDAVPYASWLISPSWSLDTYVSAGLADGSPDVGVGLQAGYGW